MKKFTFTGHVKDDTSTKYHLTVPRAKHFELKLIGNGEQDLQIQKLVTDAVRRGRELYSKHKIPNVGIRQKDNPNPNYIIVHNTHVPRTLQNILLRSEYPLSQGPVIPQLDCATEDKKSEKEIMVSKTIFTHEKSQKCFAWHPKQSGISSWEGNGYEIYNTEFNIQGAASALNKTILYTCPFLMCVIYCPCSICRDGNQCGDHILLLPRLFDVTIDHFTMKTDKMDQYRHAIPHAGIPLSCISCTRDILEHQSLHLVLHSQCKFCQHELRHFEKDPMTTFKHYVKAAKSIIRTDDRTCSYCFFTCSDIYERKKHEASLHENKDKKFKCDTCSKSYSNINAMNYHKKTKHEEVQIKFTCESCGSQFLSKETLLKHKNTIHSEQFSRKTCSYCGQIFNTIYNLYRHKKEKHREIDANLAYKKKDLIIECDLCDAKFTRNENMKRHIKNVHSSEKKKHFQCTECDIEFSRKDSHMRHISSKHGKKVIPPL